MIKSYLNYKFFNLMETKYPTVSCSNTNVQKYGHLGTTIAKKAIVALMGTAVRRHQTIKDDQFNPFIIIEGSIIQDMEFLIPTPKIIILFKTMVSK